MAWKPLKDRKLPLILAGPILRRVEREAVTVWVALREPRPVTVKVIEDDRGTISRLKGSAEPVRLGKSLYVSTITAGPDTLPMLELGRKYYYDLEFEGPTVTGLDSLGVLDPIGLESTTDRVKLTYRSEHVPSFVLPDDDIRSLRLVHGSCRKPHDPGRDALAILDLLMEKYANSDEPAVRAERPHQLFLTGDQIYAEEVMDPLLWMVMDAAEALFGWSEELPLVDKRRSVNLWPGGRADLMAKEAGLRTHAGSQLNSHLIGLGEYCAMYLFAWSPVVWPLTLPFAGDVVTYLTGLPTRTGAQARLLESLKKGKAAKAWDEDCHALEEFRKDIWRVRRALANISTYMVFDDHDVTDDWYLNLRWSIDVLKTPLGRRFIENALIAYALFQAWGNDPVQFVERPKFLQAVRALPETGPGEPDRIVLRELLGFPKLDPANFDEPVMERNGEAGRDALVFSRDAGALKWNFTVTGPKHEVIVLDTRTWRGYPPDPGDERAPAALLSPTAFKEQLADPLAARAAEVTFVIAQTNPIGIWVIDLLQEKLKSIDELLIRYKIGPRRDPLEPGVTFLDYGDAWNFHQGAFARLLATLFSPSRQRIILLSGDIHFGYAVRLSYWARKPFESTPAPNAPPVHGVMAQLTCSAFKNADGLKRLTKLIHCKAKMLIAEIEQNWAGWTKAPDVLMLRTDWGPDPVTIPIWSEVKPATRSPLVIWLDEDDDETYSVTSIAEQPDWRYRIMFVRKRPGDEARPTVFVTAPTETERRAYLEKFRQAMKVDPSAVWADPKFQGPEIVGLHNIGVIRYQPEPADKPLVFQDLYFWPYGAPDDTQYYKDTYRVSLRLDKEPPPLPVR